VTVTGRSTELVAPSSSVTVRVTVKVPSLVYSCVVFTPLPVVPSPNFQA
jgi:hypothetical protein